MIFKKKMIKKMIIKKITKMAIKLTSTRVAESVAPLHRRCEPSKDLVSQSLSSKLTERERSAHKALEHLLKARSRERERSAHKALELLLTAQSAFERERKIGSQGS